MAKEISPTGPEEVPSKVVKIEDVDDALVFLGQQNARAPTPEDEKKLIKKIDKRIVPLMFVCYTLQYLDKTLLNYAAVMGLKEDTGISGDQYSLLSTIFYISFLFFEIPGGYVLQRVPTAKYLSVNVLLWGVVVAAMAGAHDWPSLVVLRVLLGIFEAIIGPALLRITTMWYKRAEQPLRVGFWYMGIGSGTIIGSLSSYGFQFYEGKSFKSWQIMFLTFGLITSLVGFLVYVIMPDNPMTAKFLTDEEKVWAIERLRANRTGVENRTFKVSQVWDCLTDPQVWMIALIKIFSSIPNGAVSSYQAQIIKSFGYTSKETALLSVASGGILIVSILASSWAAGRFNAVGPATIVLHLLGGVLGGGLTAFSPKNNKSLQLAGNYFMNISISTMSLQYSYAANNIAGHTKKAMMSAILLMSFCIGNIIGPLTFRDQDAPNYLPAKISVMTAASLAILMNATLLVYYWWQNKRRDRLSESLEYQEDREFLNLTDRENPEFRYRY
ncbi:allantoate permease [Hypomontagnella monticulosa]|nr:allantoate permease [Hypomontagnella monticulosa]